MSMPEPKQTDLVELIGEEGCKAVAKFGDDVIAGKYKGKNIHQALQETLKPHVLKPDEVHLGWLAYMVEHILGQIGVPF